MIGFVSAAITITLNYNHLQHFTLGDCLRLVPFPSWTTSVFLSTVADKFSGTNVVLRFLRVMLRPTVSRPVCLGIKCPSGAYDLFITVRRLRVCWAGALSLTRGRVCHLQLLLALASAVTFEFQSRGTRDHILLSQMRDFPFCRLLRLAGLQWRYSTPHPHGIDLFSVFWQTALLL
jgi:hypothetical protein